MLLYTTEAMDLAIAANGIASVAALGILNGAKADLCVTNLVASKATPLADLIAGLATFTGYAQKVVTWLAPSRADDGAIEVVGTIPEWRPTDDVVPNTVYMLFIRAAVGGALLMVGTFDAAPIPMNGVLDSILETVRWRPATEALGVQVS